MRRCILFLAVAAAMYYTACGGRVEPYCATGWHMCRAEVQCCANNAACGTGINGCPVGSCCLLATEPGGPHPDPGSD
jgi:hypothetical protein